jgi:hypothetical protein
VIPYITKVEPLLEQLAGCTDEIWIYGLSIESRSYPNWQNVQRILSDHFPTQKDKIEEAIFSRDHPYWGQLIEDLLARQQDKDLNLNIHI